MLEHLKMADVQPFSQILLYLENNYQQDLCEHVIDAMIKCCAQDNARYLPRCSGFALLIEKGKERGNNLTKQYEKHQ